LVGLTEMTVIAICARTSEHGIDAGALESLLRSRGRRAVVVDDLCADETSARTLTADDPDGRLVMAVCPDGPSRGEIRARARRAGLDPGVGVLRIELAGAASFGDPNGTLERAATVLEAGVSRLEASPASSADAFRLTLPPGAISRRSLLSLPAASYEPVAEVGLEGCRGSTICGLCVDACPVDAIDRGTRVPSVEKDRCIGCAACVTTCPVDDAIRLPGADLVGSEAQLSALLASATDGRTEAVGIVIACRNAPSVPDGALPGQWMPMEATCLSGVTPGWILEALRGGARAVALRGCGAACPAKAPERIEPRTRFVADALAAIGVERSDERVRFLAPEDDSGRRSGSEPATLAPIATGSDGPIRLREPGASATLLAGSHAAGVVRSEASPFGTPSVRADGCTLCGSCSQVCPTDAFRFEQGPVAATLELDRDRCVACGHCVAICPEQVIEMERGVDIGSAGRGSAKIARSALTRCRRCGEPVAPIAMLDRISAMLPDDPLMMEPIGSLCTDCRGY
jgi:ferredoxin